MGTCAFSQTQCENLKQNSENQKKRSTYKGLIVQAKGTIGVLKKSMSGKNTVVGLNHSGRHLRRGGDGKAQLRLAAIVHTQALQQERP
jgi:hypothetical protein